MLRTNLPWITLSGVLTHALAHAQQAPSDNVKGPVPSAPVAAPSPPPPPAAAVAPVPSAINSPAAPEPPVTELPAPDAAATAGTPSKATPPPTTSGSAAAVKSTAEPAAHDEVAASFAALIDAQSGLTSSEAARRAARTSRDADMKTEDIKAADAAIEQTMWNAAPRLNLTARYTRLSPITNGNFGPGAGSLVATSAPEGPLPTDAPLFGIGASAFQFPVLLNNYLLNANLVVPLSAYLLSTTQAVRGARAIREGRVIDEKVARVRSAAEARLTYYSWVRAQLQRVVARQSLEQAKERAANIKRLQQAGRAATADVLQADAFVAESQLVVQRADTAVAISEQQLRLLMHASADEPLKVGEDVLAAPELTSDKSLNELYNEAVNQRLELRALDQTVLALNEAEEVRQADAYPRLEAFGNATYANPNQRIIPMTDEFRATWDVGVQVTWTLTNLGVADANVKSNASQRAQAVSQKRAIEDALRLEIVTALQALEEAKMGTETAKQAEQAAEAAYHARELLYQHGRATSLEVLQAQTTRFQAKLSLIDAHVALRMAKVQLDRATGRDVAKLQEVLNSSPGATRD